MYEWVNTTQCIVYINNLACFEDPKKILRIVWFTCKELYKLIEDVNIDVTELTTLKEKQFKFQDKIKDIRKNIRELNTTMNTSKNIIQLMDDQLKDMIGSQTSDIVNSNFSLFDEWWKENIETTNEDVTILSTDLWLNFKHDNKNVLKELDITVDKFRQYIKSKVPFSSLIIKNKNANSAFEIKGITFKKGEEAMEEKLELELEFIEEPVLKKKKVIKRKQEIYFNEKLDNKIIEDYENIENNIIAISEKHSVRPWQVVSLLMKKNIIQTRDESRGYDKYKETDEYKNKIKK